MKRIFSPTRSFGLLEGFLAKKRAQKANALIPDQCRQGTIVDIGCGSFPLFLRSTQFQKKIGIDQIDISQGAFEGITLISQNMTTNTLLPFAPDSIDTVSLLAFIEHIDQIHLPNVFEEIYRVLKKGGVCILTTPGKWTEFLLNIMTVLGLISKEEIQEHRPLLSTAQIIEGINSRGQFKIEHGYFECFMNRWFLLRK